jgi:hypothetical protein
MAGALVHDSNDHGHSVVRAMERGLVGRAARYLCSVLAHTACSSDMRWLVRARISELTVVQFGKLGWRKGV